MNVRLGLEDSRALGLWHGGLKLSVSHVCLRFQSTWPMAWRAEVVSFTCLSEVSEHLAAYGMEG
jgi:hypothetical protein